MEIESTSHCIFEVMDKLAFFQKLFTASAKSEVLDKYAAALADHLCSMDEESIPLELGVAKMASETDLDLGLSKLAFLGFGKDTTNVLTVGAIKHDLKIAYLPDRVLFISHGMVVSQLNTFEMNEEGYAHFAKKDSDYFHKLFFTLAKQAEYEGGVEKTAGTEKDKQEEEEAIEEPIEEHAIAEDFIDGKTASYALSRDDLFEDMFTSSNVHPKVYYLLMMKQFGERWLGWDMETIESMIKDNIGVTTIGNIAMDKLMCISLLFNNTAAFKGYHTFEKVIRVFNNKNIDFDLRESNLSLGEFVNAMRIMGDLLSDVDNNLYDNFSEPVFNYLIEVLVAQNYRACAHKTQSGMEAAFWKLVNVSILNFWNHQLPNGIFGNEGKGKIENSLVQRIIIDVTEQYRKEIDMASIRDTVEQRCIEAGLRDNAYVEIIVNNVLNGLAVDKFIPYINSIRDEQIKKFIA